MQLPRRRSIARAYLMSIGFWGGMALLMGLQYQPLNIKHLGPSVLNLLLQTATHAFALALWTPPIFYLVARYLKFSQHRLRYFALWTFGAVPFVVLYTLIAYLVIPPYVSRSVGVWLGILRTSFADAAFIYIAMVVAAHAYEYLKSVRKQEAERCEYQQALAASELQALKTQLQPHFLFNTLHGIATLTDEDPRRARAMIVKLSNLLRIALARDSSDLVALDDELKFVKDYLDLEKMRFGARLRVEWKVAEDCYGLLVPPMILQPLAENAIRHGAESSREGGWMELEARSADGALLITVRNSAGTKPSNGNGVGLRNIEARLRYLYSGEANLTLSVAEDRTVTARLVLPALGTHTRRIPAAV